MTEHDLSDGYPEYRRPPPDIVPRWPRPADDIPTGPTEVTYYEMTEHGIERITEHVYVTRPITGGEHHE